MEAIRNRNEQRARANYFVHSYGCKQNVADCERIRGILELLGFKQGTSTEKSDIIIYNTCGVRRTATDRVLGNIGALKKLKIKNPELIIGVCGCMVEQEGVADYLARRFPFVDLIFGTNLIHHLPRFLYEVSFGARKIRETKLDDGIVEGLPISREAGVVGLVPITYGCDNFCSYCVVPYVRGRERSREPEVILNEIRDLVAQGYKEITLLGQNVNSYGKGLACKVNFAELLAKIDSLPGRFRVRFLTSHPKDCSKELIDTIAGSEKICKQIHLPVQSGSDDVLRLMNRGYTREQYLDLVRYLKEKIPGVSLGSDIIVGFPGEGEREFLQTLSLVKEIKFNLLFTFVYSPRKGTRAADMPDATPKEEKKAWLGRLLKEQELISDEQNAKQCGKVKVVLPERFTETAGKSVLLGKCGNGFLVEFEGERGLIGEFVEVKIVGATRRSLVGERMTK
ncbi:MAG: tRNA (N6-isopentenyl adenosine(37)-C2)-methylthiotransferase MiaB [Oscillospiraceae bacterium]|jgi:tRNA-2-methylthio-N6-dimethylallyladenosine synthase|nr:tRNA (N6-isopentenyl adenosine(37)-C2)-methylthiotransferase MiaB [Oscillospiraceae bacterium]